MAAVIHFSFVIRRTHVMWHLLNEDTTYTFLYFLLWGHFFDPRPSGLFEKWTSERGGSCPRGLPYRKCVVNIATTFNFPSFFKLINNSVIERSDRGRYEVIVDGRRRPAAVKNSGRWGLRYSAARMCAINFFFIIRYRGTRESNKALIFNS